MGSVIVSAGLVAGGLFAGILLLLEIGRRLGIRRRARLGEGAGAGFGALEGALFALMGLLIAFTFSSAAQRFEVRRHLIVTEANDIGTAWLRLDLLPAESQPALRESFRRYLDARIAGYKALPDIEAAMGFLDQASEIQGEIWGQAVAAAQAAPSPHATMLLLPSLNAMFDIASSRTAAAKTHAPPLIFAMLVGLALACSLLAGYDMSAARNRSWIHAIGFAAILSGSVYVIFDLEYPRMGLIHLAAFDQLLVDVRAGMR